MRGPRSRESETFFLLLSRIAEERLTARQAGIFSRRYGLEDGEGSTLASIGVEWGISRERVRQILAQTARRLRAYRGPALPARPPEFAVRQWSFQRYIASILLRDDDQDAERIADFAAESLGHLATASAHALLVDLLVGRSNERTALPARLAMVRRQRERAALERLNAERQVGRIEKWLDGMEAGAFWPVGASPSPADAFVGRSREVNPDSAGEQGWFYSEKLHRQVCYESGIERAFLWNLEECPSVTFYQEQPLEVRYPWRGEDRRYYPDVLYVRGGRPVVVELKPRFHMGLAVNRAKWTALWRFCQQQRWGLLVTDGRRTLSGFRTWSVPAAFRSDVMTALKHGPLDWQGYAAIRDRHGVDGNDFVGLVVSERLLWELQPFVLSRAH